jgi:acetyltransferase-like isoleucine patch superfamily enzyme
MALAVREYLGASLKDAPGLAEVAAALHLSTRSLHRRLAEEDTSFRQIRERLRQDQALQVGRGTSLYLGVMFDLGQDARMKIGSFVLMNGARIICDSEITVGDHCLISWNVVLMDTYRLPLDPIERRAELQKVPNLSPRRTSAEARAQPIHIGPNVWIGFDSCVLPGVTIGQGAVVGARSVVTADVPPYTIVAGNPARIIRHIENGEGKQSGAAPIS